MNEDADDIVLAPAESTEEVDSNKDEALAQASAEPEKSEQTEDGSDPEKAEQPAFDPNEEHELEFGGKKFSVKASDLVAALEKTAALTEKEKSLNRDYTQKTQALAAQRKSLEESFGRMPEPQEIKALGKVWQSYFTNPQVQQVIDAILSDQPIDSVLAQTQASGKGSKDPVVSGLQQEILGLKNQLSQFLSSSEQEKQSAAYNEGKRTFDTWRSDKASKGVNVPEDIIDAVIETASILRRRNPEWDVQKALDEALRRETIEQSQLDTTKNVLRKADAAKKNSPIKITPKAPVKSDKNKSYAEIFSDAI